MGQRLSAAIKQAKTTRAQLAREIGCTRQTLGYACKDGSVSLELLAEVVRKLPGASLDWIVLGRHPTADPEFKAKLDRLLADAAALKPQDKH